MPTRAPPGTPTGPTPDGGYVSPSGLQYSPVEWASMRGGRQVYYTPSGQTAIRDRPVIPEPPKPAPAVTYQPTTAPGYAQSKVVVERAAAGTRVGLQPDGGYVSPSGIRYGPEVWRAMRGGAPGESVKTRWTITPTTSTATITTTTKKPATTPFTSGNDVLGLSGIPIYDLKQGSGFGVLSDPFSQGQQARYEASAQYQMARIQKAQPTTVQGGIDLIQGLSPRGLVKGVFLGNEKENAFLTGVSSNIASRVTGRPQPQVIEAGLTFRDKGSTPPFSPQPTFAQKINPLLKPATGPTASAPERFIRHMVAAPMFEPATTAGNVVIGAGIGGTAAGLLPAAGARLAASGVWGARAVNFGRVAGWPILGVASGGLVTWNTLQQPKGKRADYLGTLTGTTLIPGSAGFMVGYNPDILARPVYRAGDVLHTTKGRYFPTRATTPGVVHPEVIDPSGYFYSKPTPRPIKTTLGEGPSQPVSATGLVKVTPEYSFETMGGKVVEMPHMRDISPVYEYLGGGKYQWKGITSSKGGVHDLITVFQRVKAPVIKTTKGVDLTEFNQMVAAQKYLPGRTSEGHIFGGLSMREVIPKGSTKPITRFSIEGMKTVGTQWYRATTEWELPGPAPREVVLFEGMETPDLLPPFMRGKTPKTIRIMDKTVRLVRAKPAEMVGDVSPGIQQVVLQEGRTAAAKPQTSFFDLESMPVPKKPYLLEQAGRGFDINKISVNRASRLTGDQYRAYPRLPQQVNALTSGKSPVEVRPAQPAMSRVGGSIGVWTSGGNAAAQLTKQFTRHTNTPIITTTPKQASREDQRVTPVVISSLIITPGEATRNDQIIATIQGLSHGTVTTELPIFRTQPVSKTTPTQPPRKPKVRAPPGVALPPWLMGGGGRRRGGRGFFTRATWINPTPTIASFFGVSEKQKKTTRKRRNVWSLLK